MFQYQIYPSGAVSNYVPRVNNVSGVSAILDKRMGIIEYSLSGVAFYIKAISEYINQCNVGISGMPITSGYFNHLGFTSYILDEQAYYPFATSVEGIVSGVSTIYSSGVSIYDSTPEIRSLRTNSGQFDNVFFDNGFKGVCNTQNFIFSGVLKNIFSGYIPTNVELRLPLSQNPIQSVADYPYDTSSGILSNVYLRQRLDSNNGEMGLIQNLLTCDSCNFISDGDLNISGNLYVSGIYKPNLSAYGVQTYYGAWDNGTFSNWNGGASTVDFTFNFAGALTPAMCTVGQIPADISLDYGGGPSSIPPGAYISAISSTGVSFANFPFDPTSAILGWLFVYPYLPTPTFCEWLFQLKSHNHDGINSAALSFARFNSDRVVTDSFSIIQTSGNLTIGQGYVGNDVGLASNWERFDIPNTDNIQKLITCKDRLYALDNYKLFEVDTGVYIEATTGVEYPRAHVIATKNGDMPALVELAKGRDYNLSDINDLDNIQYIRITPFISDQSYELGFTYQGINEDFKVVTARKEIPMDRGTRIGSKLYLAFYEIIDSMNVLTLYEINTIIQPMTMKTVAHYELQGSDWRFMKTVKYKNCIYYFIKGTDGIQYVAVYNTIYQSLKDSTILRAWNSPSYLTSLTRYQLFEYAQGKRTGFNIFENKVYTYLESTGLNNLNMSTATTTPITNDFTFYMGKVYLLWDTYISRYSAMSRNRISMFSDKTNVAGASIVSYAGKLWSGQALEVGKDSYNNISIDNRLLLQVKDLTRLSSPWLVNPIVYRGWLYALAPTQVLADWQGTMSQASQWKIAEYLPGGTLILRRRASETELANMRAYSL